MSRALASWRLSPGVSPVSCSRRSSSTTACLTRSRLPLASLSTFSLYLRDQFPAFSCRRTWPTSWQQRILMSVVRPSFVVVTCQTPSGSFDLVVPTADVPLVVDNFTPTSRPSV